MKRLVKRSGFTLIEVILVIAIVAIVTLILAPSVLVLVGENNKRSCENLKKSIETAAKMYVTNNKYSLGFECDSPNNTKNIKFRTLIESGDLRDTKLINPVTDEEISEDGIVTVTYDCSSKEFTYAALGINCEK